LNEEHPMSIDRDPDPTRAADAEAARPGAHGAASPEPVLTAAETAAIEAAFREELRAEHEARLEKLKAQKERARSAAREGRENARMLAENTVKERLREQFQKENGYKRYTDSTGREFWLPPEEYAFRMKRREGRQRNRILEPAELNKRRIWLFYVGLFFLAVLVGALIAR
jgi:hypothetical protein